MGKKRSDYIPGEKYEIENWAIEFQKVADENVGHFGINADMNNKLKTVVENYSKDLETEKQLVDQKRQQVKKTQKDRKDLTDFCRGMAQIIKNDPAYDEQVGKQFDIIGAEKQIDVDNSKPALKTKKVPHGWEFSFGLNGYFNGVNIYRKRPDEEDFTYLATDTRSPYVDNQDMTNGTQYFAYFILGDTEVGQRSDVVTIQV